MSGQCEVLRVINLCKSYNGKSALVNFCMSLYEGETIGIIGLHDSGKTLLLKILNGNEPWDCGQILYREKHIAQASLRENLAIQLINTNLPLNPMLSVLENTFVIRKRRGRNPFVYWRKLRKQFVLCFNELGIAINADQFVYKLTLADQHIAAIVKAYVFGAKIIMLENIMANYTPKEHQTLLGLLDKLKKRGISFIITGYQLSTLNNYADHMLFLQKGFSVTILRNFQQYRGNRLVNEYQVLLGQRTEERSIPRKIEQATLFEAINISTKPGERISFSIQKGEIAVILDFSYTTNNNLVSALLGKTDYQGTFMLADKPVKKQNVSKNICMADYSTESVIFDCLSMQDNICLSAFKRISTLGFVSRRKRMRIVQDFLHIYESAERHYLFDHDSLSQPEKMAIYLYRILIQRWRLLVCTNPEMLFSYETIDIIKAQLKRMTESGRAICIFASSLEPYIDLADSFYLIERGSIKGKYSYEQLLSQLNT